MLLTKANSILALIKARMNKTIKQCNKGAKELNNKQPSLTPATKTQAYIQELTPFH
jgi:hypothetical protein